MRTLVVPTLIPTTRDGEPDWDATRRYALLAADTWIDRFLLNGSTARGDELAADKRAQVLDLWADIVGPKRLLACCWNPEDIVQAGGRQITPMVVLAGMDHTQSLEFLASLPADATIYSHPMFNSAGFGAELAHAAVEAGCLPAGGKLAKIRPQQIEEIHRVAPAFRTWDGSSRHIARSVEAGADGVVATPLTASLSSCVSPRSIEQVQSLVDPIQAHLDRLPDRPARTRYLLDLLDVELGSR
ncbi:hypothetical protein ACFVMC_33030 [Nocardia sp. NPDC127579]|uniref:hypothetical protein n=1 Tax=Nocardia sp. NPDC127579 TaxID=3345402 RepID=UPI003632CD2D